MACSLSEVVLLISRIYAVMIAIGYLKPSQVNWPPHDADSISIATYRAQGLTEDAINLILSIPWSITCRHFLPGAPAVNWTSEWSPDLSRHPDLMFPEVLDEWVADGTYKLLPPNFVPLTYAP